MDPNKLVRSDNTAKNAPFGFTVAYVYTITAYQLSLLFLHPSKIRVFAHSVCSVVVEDHAVAACTSCTVGTAHKMGEKRDSPLILSLHSVDIEQTVRCQRACTLLGHFVGCVSVGNRTGDHNLAPELRMRSEAGKLVSGSYH